MLTGCEAWPSLNGHLLTVSNLHVKIYGLCRGQHVTVDGQQHGMLPTHAQYLSLAWHDWQ